MDGKAILVDEGKNAFGEPGNDIQWSRIQLIDSDPVSKFSPKIGSSEEVPSDL